MPALARKPRRKAEIFNGKAFRIAETLTALAKRWEAGADRTADLVALHGRLAMHIVASLPAYASAPWGC